MAFLTLKPLFFVVQWELFAITMCADVLSLVGGSTDNRNIHPEGVDKLTPLIVTSRDDELYNPLEMSEIKKYHSI